MRNFMCQRQWNWMNALPSLLAAVGVLFTAAPLESAGAEAGGETLVQLLVPGPHGTQVPVKMHEGMILPHGSIATTPLFELQRQVLGVTDGSAAVFQGVLDHPVSPGTLTVADGVHQWTQAGGSDHPNFAVTYSTPTRNAFVLYPDSAPEAGREIVASYSRVAPLPIDNMGPTGFRLQMVRETIPPSPLIYSAGNPVVDGDRFDLEISGDCLHWTRVPLSPAFITENGALRLSNHVFTQRKRILTTDGKNQFFFSRIPEVVVPGTLLITDGIFTWSQTEGSSSPFDFSVTYAPATRSMVVAYPTEIPAVGRVVNATYDVEVRHSLATFLRLNEIPEGFVLIPAGSFTMGRTSGDTDEDAPPVNVHVSDFFMARYEVTWELWNDVRNWAVNHGYSDIAAGEGKAANHPVHTVNWWDVVKWCNARSERDYLTPVYSVGGNVMRTGTTVPVANWNANGYRLPTEAEWEKAARGGVSGQRFPWGDTMSHANANFWNGEGESYQSGTTGYHPAYHDGTSPVGSFASNGYGLYDMAGNIWEWNWDWYSATTYTEGASDPRGAISGTRRLLRGSSYVGGAQYCRSASRIHELPASRDPSRGFRPARKAVP